MSTVGLAVAYAHVTQRARVRSPVGTSFLGEFFRFFSSPVRQMPGSFRPLRSLNIIWQSLSSSLIIHYGRQWPGMLTCTKISNIGYIHTWMSTQFFQMRTHHHWYCNWWFLGTSKQCSVPGCSKDTGRHETPDCRCMCFHGSRHTGRVTQSVMTLAQECINAKTHTLNIFIKGPTVSEVCSCTK